MTASNWYAPLSSIRSLGSLHQGPGSLAGLHEARGEHLSQFFTPRDVVSFIWRMVSPAIDRAINNDGDGWRVSLLDNSIGSARMFQFATPERHTLAGFDVHAPSLEAVAAAAKNAGFEHDFIVAGMEEVRLSGWARYGVALINPPFSIHLEHPQLTPFECCSHGKFGPGTSCVSHAYAVAQALDAADIVAAVLPEAFVTELSSHPLFSDRLRYIGWLPGTAFSEEGASVRTAVVIWDFFSRGDVPVVEANLSGLATAEAPDLGLTCRTTKRNQPKSLHKSGIDASTPSITLPVTGKKEVRVVRHNRRIILKYGCGLVQAKVHNAILRKAVPASEHRYPAGVMYSGQGVLDLEVHLMQPDPLASFESLVDLIGNNGGRAVVDDGIRGFLRRRARRLQRHRQPFAHVIKATGTQLAAGSIKLIAKDTFLLDPSKWGGPVIKKGQSVEAERFTTGKLRFNVAGKEWVLTDEEVNRRFTLEGCHGEDGSSWVAKYPGRLLDRPDLAKPIRRKAESQGVTKWLTWGYQVDDLTEICLSPYGSVTAWDMGLGKSRLAAALMLMGGSKANLLVTEPHLVPEFVAELESIGLSQEMWQVIASPNELKSLKRINVVSYRRLSTPVDRRRPKFTYAKALRHRIGTMIADEGHCLRNLDTDQTRAAWAVAARRRYVFTGTLIANYPRDTLAILAWVGGSATAAQPYGIRNDVYLQPSHIVSMSYALRGIDRYRENFVTLEWVTNEFCEDMQQGGKREVPKIGNLPLYREMLAPFVKRRVKTEPEVAKFVHTPKHTEIPIVVDWTDAHLGYYLDIADNFATWYRQAKKKAGEKGNNLNMISLLARIGAVETACNIPQAGVEGFGALDGLTAKQMFAVEHVAKLAKDGHKILVYAKRPQVLNLIGAELRKLEIESILITGEQDIESRTIELRERFRKGPVPVCLASLGCTKTGLNIPEADRIVYVSRDWSATTERQANARALRPQQKKSVVIEYIHLPGSVDEYQDQMVSFKGDAADAGLDWATPVHQSDEFEHIDTVLGRFVEDLAVLRGMTPQEIRERFSRRRAA